MSTERLPEFYMEKTFDLQKHIEKGVEKIVEDTIKATFRNPKESISMASFALASKKASKRRLGRCPEDPGSRVRRYHRSSAERRKYPEALSER